MIGAWKEICECFHTVQVKALGGVRIFDQLLSVRELDRTRCGATATGFMREEAKKSAAVNTNEP